MVAVKSSNQFRCFGQKLKPLYPTVVGTLVCFLSIELPGSAAFAQLTNIASTETASVNLSTTMHPSSLLIAQTENYSIGAENFNPRLQAPLPQTEEVKIKPQPLIPSTSNPLLENFSQTKPRQPERETSGGSNNFNPGLILPPPKTEILSLPLKPPQPKLISPPPALLVPGQARFNSIPERTAPVKFQEDIQTAGRSRSGSSWPKLNTSSQTAQSNPAKPETSSQTAQSNPAKPETSSQTAQSNLTKQQEPATTTTRPLSAKGVIIILESVVPSFHNTLNDSGQINQTAETTINFALENGDRVKLVTGYNTFIKPGFATINNIPLNLSWETKIDSIKIEPSIGINLFDRLSTSPTYGLKASIPITSDLTISAAIESGAYKFNTETIQNQISAVRYGPGIAWKIDKNTSFLATYKLGNYSDGNTENQLFSRLEHKSGQFWIAGNLFSWGYGQNIGAASGYFSPADFLAYSGEVGVEGNVLFDSLHCRLSATLGSQISGGASTIGQAFQGLCKTKLSPSLEANFGYGFGNSRKDFSTEETGNTRTITGGLIYRF